MNEVRLNPWSPESTAPLPPGDGGAIGALINSVANVPVQTNSSQDIQLFRYLSGNVIVLNSKRYQIPFRHLHKTKAHDPEVLQNLSEAIKNNQHVFLRTKCACITEMPYWFTYNDLEKDINKIVSCLYLKGFIGSKLRPEIEPFESAARSLAIDFKNGLVIVGDHALKNKAFLLILPFYLKLVSIAKRTFELLGENPHLQENIQAKLKQLNINAFEQLKDADVYSLPDLDTLFNQALKENRELYFSRDMADDYELIDNEKRYKIPKGAKVIFPCAIDENPICPGFLSGMLTLRVLFAFLLIKGTIVKETKKVWGSMYVPTTITSFSFKAR